MKRIALFLVLLCGAATPASGQAWSSIYTRAVSTAIDSTAATLVQVGTNPALQRWASIGQLLVESGVAFGVALNDGDKTDITVASSGTVWTIDDAAVDSAAVATDAIKAVHIEADAVGADEIATGAVGTSEIATNGVGALEIATDAVNSAEIATDAVGSDEIAADAVGASEIATDAVGSAEIATDAVGADELADAAVDSAAVATDAIKAVHIEADAVGSSEIATGAVGSDEIATGAVGTSEIATNGVGALEIATDAVNSAEIATDAVGADELADAAVDSAAVVTAAIKAIHIDADAVGSSEIATDAVGADEIAIGAVGTSEIATNGVDQLEIATDAVNSAEIATDAVGQDELAAGAVGDSEFDETDPELETEIEGMIDVHELQGAANVFYADSLNRAAKLLVFDKCAVSPGLAYDWNPLECPDLRVALSGTTGQTLVLDLDTDYTGGTLEGRGSTTVTFQQPAGGGIGVTWDSAIVWDTDADVANTDYELPDDTADAVTVFVCLIIGQEPFCARWGVADR